MQRIDVGSETLIAFSTERGPGVIAGDSYSGFNACHYTGDDSVHVAYCRSCLAEELEISESNLIMPWQTHSDKVLTIGSLPVDDVELEGVDALATRLKNVALCINTADCVPVVLHDAEAEIVAVAHCGWRGVVNDLLKNTLVAMERMGARLENIRVVMGPSICAECFEVGEEVAVRFRERFPGNEKIVIDGGPKPHVDLGEAVKANLVGQGVKACHVSVPAFCSRCNPGRFFSARAMGIGSGRILTVAMMRGQGSGRRVKASMKLPGVAL